MGKAVVNTGSGVTPSRLTRGPSYVLCDTASPAVNTSTLLTARMGAELLSDLLTDTHLHCLVPELRP